MPIRFICDARAKNTMEIVEQMIAKSEGQLEMALHFGDRTADYHAPCLQRMEIRNGRRGHLMNTTISKGGSVQLLASPDFQEMAAQAVDQLHRNAPGYRYRSHNLQNLQDYLDYYHILSDAMAQEIDASGATHALFMNMPHLAYDLVMFQVARAMGLKTLILCQTIFPSRYFSMRNPEDMGFFDPSGQTAPPLEIEKGSVPDLFFMEDDWQKKSETGRITAGAVLSVVKHLLLREPLKALNPVYVASTLRRVNSIYRTLPKWRDPFAKFFHVNELAYFEHLAEYEMQDVDMEQKFIYVPLHNQPEMSTSSLGGRYRDQVLMIEALARKLPDGWRIYVKENPRQGSYARGPMFFHRLNRIPSVTFVPTATNTYALSSKCQFVASIVGTAGWEAIRKGKPAVVFGNAWYKSLEGVFRYSEDLDFEKVAAYTFAHEDVQRTAGNLIGRCHDGVIEDVYLNMAEDFDPDKNLEEVSNTVLELMLDKRELTFQSEGPS